jgi:hypothetical protein
MKSSPVVFRPNLRWPRVLLLGGLGLLSRARAMEPTWQFNLVGDMYREGRSAPRPTPDHPVYYFPIVRGFQQLGAKSAGDPPPVAKEIVHHLAAALAHEGYRVSSEIDVPGAKSSASARPGAAAPLTSKALSPPPSLLLVFYWGTVNPDTLDDGDAANTNPAAVLNQNQMLSMTAGKQTSNLGDFGLQTESVMQGIHDDRYYVLVSAYDFAAYNQHRQKIRLWVAKLSVPSAGTTMAEVLPALIKTGAQIFGRETSGPKILEVPVAREGRVEIGTPTVKEEAGGSPSAGEKK